MSDYLQDVTAEYAALSGFLETLPVASWAKVTAFYDWTVADEVMHLMQVDHFGLQAMTFPDRFPDIVASVRKHQAEGIELSQRMREDYGHLAPRDLLLAWRDTYEKLLNEFKNAAADTTIPWFGPSMKVQSFAAARQMEVWAHGQDVFDIEGQRRQNYDRIKNICALGVKTHGWSFRNRGLDKPPAPRVELIAPSGQAWVWNESGEDRVSGLAEDFALVVTQRRHLADTGLKVSGDSAEQWMLIAQCFAGKPADGPKPGERT